MAGMRFGKWLVIKQAPRDAGSPHTKALWLCRCDCGTEKTVVGGSLRSEISRSCGCAPRSGTSAGSRGDGKGNWISPDEAAKRQAVRSFVNGAIKRGFSWTLSDQEALAVMLGACFYCGAAPHKMHGTLIAKMLRNGIDRKDSKKGYEPDNVVTCCFLCNRMKMQMSDIEFLAHCKKIVDHVK